MIFFPSKNIHFSENRFDIIQHFLIFLARKGLFSNIEGKKLFPPLSPLMREKKKKAYHSDPHKYYS